MLHARKIPRREWGWILALRGHNIHNAAGAVLDYRTGEVLAYGGSASYTAHRSRRFQPKFDVLADGWRQPGSAIKPLGYLVGIDERRITAATVFMDVVTNFASRGTKPWYPTQADRLERGPVRVREALQFSLNIPAIKAGVLNGIKHQLAKTKSYGLRYQAGTQAVVSQSIGTLVIHPIDLIGAYGMIANGGVLVPRHTVLEVRDQDGVRVWPVSDERPKGKRVASREAAYIITDILAGNTDRRINPFWGRWRITDGVTGRRVRPAAYKTGTTQDNRDVHAYGYLAPPSRTSRCTPSSPGCGWATRTTRPTTASSRSTRRRRCGPPSCRTSRRACRSRASVACGPSRSLPRASTRSPAPGRRPGRNGPSPSCSSAAPYRALGPGR